MRTVDPTGTGFARFGLVCFLAVITGACAGNPPPGADRADARSAEPLQVWLASSPDLLNGFSVVFHVNRPAYVAVFDIQGSRVSAVYPWNPSAEQWLFDDGLNGFFRRHATFTRTCAARAASPVVHRLIVASERPLDVDALEAVSFFYRPSLRQVSYGAMSPFTVMDAVVQELVWGEASDAAGGVGSLGADVAVDYAPFWAAVDCGASLRLASLSEWARTAAWSQSGDDGAPSIKSPALRDAPVLPPPVRSGQGVAVARAGDPAAGAGGRVTPTLWSTPYPISVALKRTSATDDRVGVRNGVHRGPTQGSDADANSRVRHRRATVHRTAPTVHRRSPTVRHVSPTVRHRSPTVRDRSPAVRHTRSSSPQVRREGADDDGGR